MKTKKITGINLIVSGTLFILLGLGFVFFYEGFWNLLRIFTAIVIGLGSINNFISLIQKKSQYTSVIKVFLNMTVSILLMFFPNLFYTFIPYILGWWALINAIVYFFIFYSSRLNQSKGTISILLKSILTLFFSILLLTSPLSRLHLVGIIGGIYLIFYGIVTLIEGLSDLLSDEKKNIIVRHFNFPIPIFISALAPIQLYTAIKRQIKQQKIHYYRNAIKTDYDLEVYIYIKGDGFESFGHVDIGYKDKVYSYGCHDPLHRQLGGSLGDGVMIIADRDSFINQAIKSKSLIVSFGIKCSVDQIKTIEKRIESLLASSYQWYPTGYYSDSANDYASRVYHSTKATMYKFKEGKFKTYFVFSTNCVLLSDTLLKNDGLDLLNLDGINTPGRYLQFLEHEFSKVNTDVKGKIIYYN